MNELEGNIVDWVEHNAHSHCRAIISETFINKGYLFNDVEQALDHLLERHVLQLIDGYITQPIDSYPDSMLKMLDKMMGKKPVGTEADLAFTDLLPHGGFPGQVLDHVSDENKILKDLKHFNEATQIVIDANKKANEELVIPSSHKKNPAVHSPSHYTRGGIETIDFIEAKGLNFHLGNTVKYVSRAGYKQDALIQDLEKALWYLTREINRLKNQEP